MNDGNSLQFLVNKKIAQLIKLINHLDAVNAEREYSTSFFENNFDDFYEQLLNNHNQSLQNIYNQYESTNKKSENLMKKEYENCVYQLFNVLNDNIANLKENISEVNSYVDFKALDLFKIVKIINNNIDIFNQQIKSMSIEKIENIKKQKEKLIKEHQIKIDLVDTESNSKIKNFEIESQKKFIELSDNFNRAIEDLKSQLKHPDDMKLTVPYNNQSLAELKIKINQFQLKISKIKEKVQLYITFIQNTFCQQKENMKNLTDALRADTNNLKTEKQSLKNNDDQLLNTHNSKSHENKKYDELLLKMNEEVNELENIEKLKETVYLSLLKSHQKEIEDLKTVFVNIEKRTSIQNQNEIELLKRENINEQKIAEKRMIIHDLSSEKQALLNSLFQSDIQKLNNSFEIEKKELMRKIDNDFKNNQKQEKLLIGAVSDSHRNVFFVKNNEIARNYDSELDKIRNEYKERNYEEEINIFYSNKQKELEEEYLNISSSSLVDNSDGEIERLDAEIKKLNELKKSKIEGIQKERKLIIDSFFNQEKNESIRHEKIIKNDQEIISQKSNETNEKMNDLRNEFNSRFEKLEISCSQFKILLDKEKHKNCSSIIELNEAFDRNEKEMKNIFNKVKKDAEKEIEKVKQMNENKKEVINQQINEMKEKVEKFKQKIENKSFKKSELIEKSKSEVHQKIERIHENLKNQQNLLASILSDTLRNFQDKHSENLNALNDQISKQKEINQSGNFQEGINPSNLENLLILFTNNITNEIKEFKTKHENRINELNQKIIEIKEKNSFLQNSCNENTMRNEEVLLIEKLENEFAILDQHMKDITLDLANYKKKLVSQEGTYNSQFGCTPTVAVLRPKTGYGQVATRGSLRPNTTITINRSKALLKNRTTVVHF